MFPKEKRAPGLQAEFGQITLAVKPLLMGRAMRLTRDRDRAEDLVQATLEKGYRSFHRFRTGTSASRWLFRILTNQFIDQCRQEKAFPSTPLSEQMPLVSPMPEERSVWADLEPQEIRAAASRLPGRCREPFAMHYFERLPYQAIAARLKLPMSTVGTRIHRARHRLRQVLQARLVA
jgi:RNA polymerase sigma-70 factor (ECF subfamily)